MAGISGLGDRAAMEKERLARLAARNGAAAATVDDNPRKRDRSISPPRTTRPTKVTKLTKQSTSDPRASPEKGTASQNKISIVAVDVDLDSPSPPAPQQTSASPQTKRQIATSTPGLVYPDGVIKKTWAFGHTRTGHDIKIEEVLEKHTLRTGVLSAFQWDVQWVSSKVNKQTKFVYIMQAKEQSMRDQMLEETEDMRNTLRLCFPPMDGQINCMHSKLMLLFHPHKLRVAIPSANLMPYDWGETGVMENSVFMVDLPRLPRGETTEGASKELPSFAKELLYFLEKQGLDEDILRGVLNFDFTRTSHISFIHSSGGIHYGADMRRTGFMGLNQAVKEHGLVAQPDMQLDFTASSIGSLNDDQLRNIHTAARGGFPNTIPPKTTKKEVLPDVRNLFRIYFPTLETVAASTGGVNNGGTICFQRKWWEGENRFPRDCFRDYKSVRTGLLSHNKLLYARGHRNKTGPEKSGGEGRVEDIAWVYMGSANMSESAWGKLVWDAKRKEWKLNVKNWECGVLMRVPDKKLHKPVYEQGLAQEGGKKMPVSLEVFDGVAGVPFEYPGREFGDREPWYFTEPH